MTTSTSLPCSPSDESKHTAPSDYGFLVWRCDEGCEGMYYSREKFTEHLQEHLERKQENCRFYVPAFVSDIITSVSLTDKDCMAAILYGVLESETYKDKDLSDEQKRALNDGIIALGLSSHDVQEIMDKGQR